MADQSDEDKLIQVLQDHRNLKYWVMQQLRARMIECQETYGNNSKGDIVLEDSNDALAVQDWAHEMHHFFNPDEPLTQQASGKLSDASYLEIKTTYLCGQEAEYIITKGTVVVVVSAAKISRPSQKKLAGAGISFVANVSRSQFR
ncbi:hypothetical protein VB712_08310 [Spirulina sp. CCNP1310]|uniref:hypothetical protein n=1 Tax=Spirulina sp. CCNP1310 TaxID=3110249 RepID=UPI002B1F3A1B|nr:hypothetical protein [Spirulina sp. CCNP1310]MEA5419230.1 hypothetical protein [Spirulina sp. CCNP1310]